MNQPQWTGAADRFRWAILLVFFLMMCLSGVGNFLYPATTSFIAADIGLTASQIGMLGGAPFFGALLFNLLSGYFVDLWGVRISTLVCGAFLLGCLLLSSLAGGFEMLLFLAVILGVGLSFLNPLTQKGTFQWFPPRELGLAVGVKQSGIPAGSALNAAILPLVCAAYGWRAGFIAAAIFSVVILLVSLLIYREPAKKSGVPEISVEPPKLIHVLEPARRLGPLLVGFIGITHGALTIALLNFFIPMLADSGVSPVVAGFYLAIAQIISVFSRPVVGVISDRFGSKGRRTFLGLYIGIGSIAVVFLPLLLSVATETGVLALIAIGFGLVNSWSGLYYAVIAEIGGASRVGVSTSFGALANSIGTSMGPMAFGLLADFTSSWTPGLLTLSAASVLSGFLCVLFSRRGVP